MWQLYEPLHALTYFADESADEFKAAGLKGFWMGYFAGRAAPMGPVGPAVVGATFFNFHPSRVARALPDAWSLASPDRVLDARLAGVDRAMRRVLGAHATSAPMRRAAELARTAVEQIVVDGRPLAAANAALDWPEEPHLVLWQGATILREHRGDGHVAALLAAGLDGCQALVAMAATGAVPRDLLQTSRGWDDEEWEVAAAALMARGWLEPDGRASAAGQAAHQEIEDVTDRLAAAPWEHLGASGTTELAGILEPWVAAVVGAGLLPLPNPIGLRVQT
jgi:hypothetical protein